MAVRDNEFRLRLIAFKLYTVSSKSLMQSVVLLKYHTITEKGEERWEKSNLKALSLLLCAQRLWHNKQASPGSQSCDPTMGIDETRHVASQAAPRRKLNGRRAQMSIDAHPARAAKLMTAKIGSELT